MKDYRLGLYEKALPSGYSIAQKLACAKECGFDYMEMSIDETDERLSRLKWDITQIGAVISDMCHTGMPVSTMCLSAHRKYPIGSDDPQTCERGMEILRDAVLLASRLGIRIIQFAGYDVYYDQSTPETRERFGENLLRCVEFAARYGVMLAFETMETEFMNTVGKAAEYVKRVNSPYLQIYPDTGNITNAAAIYKTSVADDLQAGRGRIAALHMKEALPGVYRDLIAGEGHVDFASIISAVYRMGVKMYTVEMWCNGDGWENNILKARKLFEDILDRVTKDAPCGNK